MVAPLRPRFYVASSESGERERGKKFEYEAGGVREYWLIDPDRQQAEFYRLVEGRYRLVYPDSEGLYRSEVLPGFWLEVEWLWQEPLPPILEILGKLRLV
jgi:Uma2 family endonuclease